MYIHVYMYVYACVYIYIYICIKARWAGTTTTPPSAPALQAGTSGMRYYKCIITTSSN